MSHLEYGAKHRDALTTIIRRCHEYSGIHPNYGVHHVRYRCGPSDHNNADRYKVIVFFDSYESAMENAKLSETEQFAQKQGALLTNMSFHDLDVMVDADI